MGVIAILFYESYNTSHTSAAIGLDAVKGVMSFFMKFVFHDGGQAYRAANPPRPFPPHSDTALPCFVIFCRTG